MIFHPLLILSKLCLEWVLLFGFFTFVRLLYRLLLSFKLFDLLFMLNLVFL